MTNNFKVPRCTCFNISDRCFYTPPTYVYSDVGLSLIGSTSVVFAVKTGSDATIALTKDQSVYTANIYEIVIGGWSNGKSAIR